MTKNETNRIANRGITGLDSERGLGGKVIANDYTPADKRRYQSD